MNTGKAPRKVPASSSQGQRKNRAAALRRRLKPLSNHLIDILNGSLNAVKNKTNRMRYSFAAVGLRELLRETFELLAPDQEILRCKWFKPDRTSKSGVTRRHRIRFTVYGYVSPKVLLDPLSADVERLAKDIIRNADDLSEYTHVTKTTLGKPIAEAERLIDSALALFVKLFRAVDLSRETLKDQLEIALSDHLDSVFFNEIFGKLDILSTHTRTAGVCDVIVDITDIKRDQISFKGDGIVECDLQYGSDGDVSRGDGVEWSDSYPFTFEGTASTENLEECEVEPSSIDIDTSSYYE